VPTGHCGSAPRRNTPGSPRPRHRGAHRQWKAPGRPELTRTEILDIVHVRIRVAGPEAGLYKGICVIAHMKNGGVARVRVKARKGEGRSGYRRGRRGRAEGSVAAKICAVFMQNENDIKAGDQLISDGTHNPSLTCAEIRCTLRAGANPARHLLRRLGAAVMSEVADPRGNDRV